MMNRILLGLAIALIGALGVAIAVVADGYASAFRSADVGGGAAAIVVAAFAAPAVLLAGVVWPRVRALLVAGLAIACGAGAWLVVEIAREGADPSIVVPLGILAWWIAFAAGQLRAQRA